MCILKLFVPIKLNIKSEKFLIKKDNATPLLVALVIIERVADILFAIDLIPPVLATPSDYFIVITSNIFAILGLRSLNLLLLGYYKKILLFETCISITAFLYWS